MATIEQVELYWETNGGYCDSCPCFSRWTEAHGETLTQCAVLDGSLLVHGRFVATNYKPDDCPGVE